MDISLRKVAKAILGPMARAALDNGERFRPDEFDLQVSNGSLTLEGVSLAGLPARYGSPLHVVSESRLHRNAHAFQHPDCEVFYSYKTNPVSPILRLLHQDGVGAEVVSHYEYWLARHLDVPPAQTIVNGPAKSAQWLDEAITDEVLLINLNDAPEVALCESRARLQNRKPVVGIRVGVAGGWAGQFGIPAGDAAIAAFRQAQDSPYLDLAGIHVHQGQQLRTEKDVVTFMNRVLTFCDRLTDEAGIKLRFLDIGGSLACPTVGPYSSLSKKLNSALLLDLPVPDAESCLSPQDYSALVATLLREHYQGREEEPPRLLLEPGRALTANTQILLTSVKAVNRGTREPHLAYMDAGTQHAESLHSEYHEVFSASNPVPGDQPWKLVGPSCNPGDWLYQTVRLPALEPGQTLAVMDSGAYFIPYSTQFSHPRPAVVSVAQGEVRLLRRAESYRDLVRHDIDGHNDSVIHDLELHRHRQREGARSGPEPATRH